MKIFEDFISKKKFNKNFLSLLKKNFFISNKKNHIDDFLADEIKTENSQDIKNNLFIIGQKYLLKFFILLESYVFRFLPLSKKRYQFYTCLSYKIHFLLKAGMYFYLKILIILFF